MTLPGHPTTWHSGCSFDECPPARPRRPAAEGRFRGAGTDRRDARNDARRRGARLALHGDAAVRAGVCVPTVGVEPVRRSVRFARVRRARRSRDVGAVARAAARRDSGHARHRLALGRRTLCGAHPGALERRARRRRDTRTLHRVRVGPSLLRSAARARLCVRGRQQRTSRRCGAARTGAAHRGRRRCAAADGAAGRARDLVLPARARAALGALARRVPADRAHGTNAARGHRRQLTAADLCGRRVERRVSSAPRRRRERSVPRRACVERRAVESRALEPQPLAESDRSDGGGTAAGRRSAGVSARRARYVGTARCTSSTCGVTGARSCGCSR